MSESSSVEQRLDFLEGQNEAFKRSGLLLVILVVVMGASLIFQGRNNSRSLSSEGIIFNRNSGQPRAALTSMPNGHLGLVFFDSTGQLPRNLQYEAIPYLDGIAIYDKTGRPRILMGMDANDNPTLAVVSPEGKVLFSAIPPAEGAPPQTQDGEQAEPTPTPAVSPTP